jgi:23S rRNA (cytosine1962-C5)-methyltransferase
MASVSELENAWAWRESRGLFSKSEALRIFHGPGEGKAQLRSFAIDRFGEHYWVTEWENSISSEESLKVRKKIVDFLISKGALSVVGLNRPEQGVAPEVEVYSGTPPTGKFSVREQDCQFWIEFQKTRHPGLFLDHEPLRVWLREHSTGLRVLNTFAYTGSLSIAAGKGGAAHVTTLDLSKATIQWAKENSLLNQLPESGARFIAGDVFEWLPRLAREGSKFDCIILDPPSFSHGSKGRFSTAKDLEKLHSLAMDLLAPAGFLVTSINSANISWKKYETDVLSAAQKKRYSFQVLRQIDVPETFPTLFGQSATRYLKGWILRRMS